MLFSSLKSSEPKLLFQFIGLTEHKTTGGKILFSSRDIPLGEKWGEGKTGLFMTTVLYCMGKVCLNLKVEPDFP